MNIFCVCSIVLESPCFSETADINVGTLWLQNLLSESGVTTSLGLGPMLWSEFSATLTNFPEKNGSFSWKTIAHSFKHNQTWQGTQVCRPAQTRETNLSPSCEFQCDQMQEENSIGSRQSSHPASLSWTTSLSPSSDQGDKLVGLVTSGYV
jgi:hypothetical protein